MKTWPIEAELKDKVLQALAQSPWFKALDGNAIKAVCDLAHLVSYDNDEYIVSVGEAADSFFLLLKGTVAIEALRRNGEAVELGRVRPPFSFGEIGLLLGKKRTASVRALETVNVLSFGAQSFRKLFDGIPDFRAAVARGLASRLEDVSELVLPPPVRDPDLSDESVQGALPLAFMKHNRVLPLTADGNRMTVGFVEDPTPQVLAGIRQHLPGIEVDPVTIPLKVFSEAITQRLDSDKTRIAIPVDESLREGQPEVPARLRTLLERLVAEGGSDLHLLACRRPVLRLDGDTRILEDAELLEADEAARLLEPLMEKRHRHELDQRMDADFGLSLPDLGRFRVNLYRNRMGSSAAIRLIPWQILSLEKLGMPSVLKTLCTQPKGLVLVSGPTGSGKSTTLAAMIDHINRTRNCHIVTLEDPIEFVHRDQDSVVNQREVGAHVESYARGLRAALREDPDVVLLGEIRDAEEAALALEIANTGHLVFSTIHTNSAISAVERVVDLFPPETQHHARASLADNLRGVICQTLCKARSGGRVAAVEILVGTPATANLIREAKPAQLANQMQVGVKDGNRLLNEDLARLVKERKVLRDEAMTKAIDKKDLVLRLGKAGPPAGGGEAAAES